METRGKWTDLIPDVGLKISEVFDQGDDLYNPGILSILNVKNGSGAQKNYTGKTPFGTLKKFAEGDNIPETARYKTYTTKVIYNNYGESVKVTKNNIEDRDFETQLNEMKGMSEMANYSVDESAMQLFNGGFATTTSIRGYEMTWYGDGVPQFSTVHPTVVPGGSTQSNASSTSIPLSHDNYETARIALALQQTDNGLALTMAGKNMLVLPIKLEKVAMETLSSELTPESANNALNFFRGSTDVVTSKFLDSENGGSATAWYLISQGGHELFYETRQEKRLEQDTDILSKTVTFTVDGRWANGSLDWRASWASKGENSAYSS